MVINFYICDFTQIKKVENSRNKKFDHSNVVVVWGARKTENFFQLWFYCCPSNNFPNKKNVSYKTIKKNVHLSTFKIPKAVRASHIAVLCRDNDVRSNDIKSRKVNLRSFHFALFFYICFSCALSQLYAPWRLQLYRQNYL